MEESSRELPNLSGAAVRGEAGADSGSHHAWKRAILYTDTIGGKQTCRDDLWAITTTELKALQLARAADAPSEPSELRQALIDVRHAIQFSYDSVGGIDKMPVMMHHDGNVVEFIDSVLKSRAADALDSQPTDLAAQPWIATSDTMPSQYREVHLKHKDGMVRIGRWSIKGGGSWQLACYGGNERSLWRKDDVTHWCTLACDISSQPTDGGVRNG